MKKSHIFLAIFALVLIVIGASRDEKLNKQNNDSGKNEPLPQLTKWHWEKSGFDNVMILSGKIINTSSKPIRDIKIICNCMANSGTHLGSATNTLYETALPNKTLTFKNLNMGFIHNQTSSANCNIESYK